MRIRFTNLTNFVMSVPMSIFEIRKTLDILEFAFDKNEYQCTLIIDIHGVSIEIILKVNSEQ